MPDRSLTVRLEAVHPVLMVADVTKSIQFYQRLGFELAFVDSPNDARYAGVKRDGVELHLQWHHAQDLSPGDRPTYRFLVSQVDALSAEFATLNDGLDRTEVQDTAWGTREFHVRDPDRNGLHFYRPS